MVGHQTVGMHRAFELVGQLAQVREVARIVIVVKEARAPVIAALNDMDRDIGHGDARTAGHRTSPGRSMFILGQETWSVPYFCRSPVARNDRGYVGRPLRREGPYCAALTAQTNRDDGPPGQPAHPPTSYHRHRRDRWPWCCWCHRK